MSLLNLIHQEKLLMVNNAYNYNIDNYYLASSNKTLISFSESPLHLLTIEDAEILKKVVLHSVATALASIVFKISSIINITFPVPGGPNNNTPFHGSKIPLNCKFANKYTCKELRILQRDKYSFFQ